MKPRLAPTQNEFSEKQRQALLKLLADEDPEVWESIRDMLVASGPQAAQWLKPHVLSHDPILRRHAKAIIREFDQHAADNEFVVFCLNTGQNLDLEKGLLLLAKTAYPDINPEGYTALLDAYAARARERLYGISDAAEKLEKFRTFIHEDLGFAGNTDNYHDPQNSYINRVLDRRTGLPITLCAIYILLAKRLPLPIAGIGLPGHFLCRYQTSKIEVYIDAFNRGRLFSKADCMKRLLRSIPGASEEDLSPVTTRRILLRVCTNLLNTSEQTRDQGEMTRFRRYIVALAGHGA